MPQVYSFRQLMIGVVLSAIIFSGLGYLAGNINLVKNIAQKSPMTSTETAEKTTAGGLDLSHPLIPQDYAFDVSDQAAGGVVLISKTAFVHTAWLAVHEDRDGRPGNILGAQLVPMGTSRGVTTDLLRPTVSGVYYAMVHEDAADGDFDYQANKPILENGTPIMRRFLVGAEGQNP